MVERFVLWLDDRVGIAGFAGHALRKAFPDHWSFMLGELNLYCFVALVATGTFLALFFDPAHTPVVYHGPYHLLDGAQMSTAYASALRLSFEVRLGLFMRQMHHWAALIFLAGIVAHMARVFFTGAFRKPRDMNWLVGLLLFLLAMGAGFTGYSLPDDLLSGLGLRIADAVLLSIPFVGTWASFLLLGGVFPTAQMGSRLFVGHVYVLPLAIFATIGLHLAILWRQKHAQFRGPHREEGNVVGSPMIPNYAAKSLALAFGTFAMLALLGGFVQINPIWAYGPYRPWQAIAPAQPDWYVGWLEGALRMGPSFGLAMWRHEIPSIFWPGVVLPGGIFSLLFAWPFLEAAITGDRASHNLLDGMRDAPVRSGIGIALFIFAVGMTLMGSDDVQARFLHVSIDGLTQFYRIFELLAPPLAFVITFAILRAMANHEPPGRAPRVRLRRNAQGGFDEEVVS